MRRLLVALAVVALLAGCANPPVEPASPLPPGLVLVEGVVVDSAIRPVAEATVRVQGSDQTATVGPDGAFALTLPLGAAVLEATHPRFAPVQLAIEVQPVMPAKIVLELQFSADAAPYRTLVKYDGFIVCSVGVSYVFSEECGEGVGTPAGRFGKQGNNAIRYDFQAENPALKTVVVEQVWVPTSEAGQELLVHLATAWTCEPACGGESVGEGSAQGPSPLLLRVDETDLAPHLQDPATVFTTYTLARNDATAHNVILNQAFQLFVSTFYREPAPDGYSFVAEGL